jgi:Lrp/AsnC family transcriptional regulator for asnA, asnC and gidA
VLALELDEVDRKILQTLRKDARTPFTDIGKDLGMSDATVHVRVKRMIDEGIIKRYTIDLDEEISGRKVHGLLLLDVKHRHLEEAAKQLVTFENVTAVYEIHGSNDLMLKIDTVNLEELRSLVLQIRGMPNIENTELITIYKVWK